MTDAVAWRVRVGGDVTTAIFEAAGDQRGVFVCAHGAGGNIADRGTLAAAKTARAAGLGVVRFNFLYRERGSGRPDPMPKLMECCAAVAERVRQEVGPTTLVIGGRSMGGRAASMLAAAGFDASALLLLAYPLHPPGRHDALRDAHLSAIRIPVLCFNGTRDEFCDPALMRQVLTRVGPNWTMHWLEHADHGFHVLRKSGRTDTDVLGEVRAATSAWLDAVAGAR